MYVPLYKFFLRVQKVESRQIWYLTLTTGHKKAILFAAPLGISYDPGCAVGANNPPVPLIRMIDIVSGVH